MGLPNRPRILVLTSHFPYPLNAGGRVRQYHLLRRLQKDFDITLLSFAGEPLAPHHYDAVAPLVQRVETVLRPAPATERIPSRWRQLARSLGDLASPPPSLLLRSYDVPEMHARLRALLAGDQFDLVQVDFINMGWYLPASPRPPVIFVAHDVLYRKAQRFFHATSGVNRRLASLADWLKTRPFEEAVWRASDHLVAMSEFDALTIRRAAPGVPLTVIPNGVDTDHYRPSDGPKPADPELLYVGWMYNAPNLQGVTYFLDAIWPQIRRAVPNATFTVVGEGTQEALAGSAQPGVSLAGYVEDIQPLLARCAAFVVPLRAGSGTRLKILEAMASGCAIVSTSVGCEGIEAVDGQHLLVADQPGAFAHAAISLLQDQQRAASLGRRARALVEDSYSWEYVVADQKLLYDKLLSGNAQLGHMAERR